MRGPLIGPTAAVVLKAWQDSPQAQVQDAFYLVRHARQAPTISNSRHSMPSIHHVHPGCCAAAMSSPDTCGRCSATEQHVETLFASCSIDCLVLGCRRPIPRRTGGRRPPLASLMPSGCGAPQRSPGVRCAPFLSQRLSASVDFHAGFFLYPCAWEAVFCMQYRERLAGSLDGLVALGSTLWAGETERVI